MARKKGQGLNGPTVECMTPWEQEEAFLGIAHDGPAPELKNMQHRKDLEELKLDSEVPKKRSKKKRESKAKDTIDKKDETPTTKPLDTNKDKSWNRKTHNSKGDAVSYLRSIMVYSRTCVECEFEQVTQDPSEFGMYRSRGDSGPWMWDCPSCGTTHRTMSHTPINRDKKGRAFWESDDLDNAILQAIGELRERDPTKSISGRMVAEKIGTSKTKVAKQIAMMKERGMVCHRKGFGLLVAILLG